MYELLTISGWALALLLLSGLVLQARKRRCRARQPWQQRPARSTEAQAAYQNDIPFEDRWNTGPLRCTGKICNPEHPCSEPERWMCRDVIAEVIPRNHFRGQFPLQLPYAGKRFPDFAIETQQGKRIIVELDGYSAHVENLDSSAFNEQLLRQNALVLAGWTVLRFSFSQLRDNPEYCRKVLQAATRLPPVFDRNFNKTPVLTTLCPEDNCKGSAVRLRAKDGAFFWKCETCHSTFDDRNYPFPFF